MIPTSPLPELFLLGYFTFMALDYYWRGMDPAA